MLAPAALSVASAFGAPGIRRGKWPYLALGSAAAWVAFLVHVYVTLPRVVDRRPAGAEPFAPRHARGERFARAEGGPL